MGARRPAAGREEGVALIWLWVLGAVVLLVLFRISVKYRRAFSPEHLREFSQGVFDLRDEAERARVRESDDPVFRVTMADIALMYSIRADGDVMVHHISMSHRKGYLARALGGRLFLFVLFLLNPRAEVTVWIGKTDVYHLVFPLGEAGHHEVMGRVNPVETEAGAARFFEEVSKDPREMIRRLVNTRPPQG